MEKKIMASNIVHVSWQVYGNHPVYGSNSLLYIGIATD
jgi:hypothetical protein